MKEQKRTGREEGRLGGGCMDLLAKEQAASLGWGAARAGSEDEAERARPALTDLPLGKADGTRHTRLLAQLLNFFNRISMDEIDPRADHQSSLTRNPSACICRPRHLVRPLATRSDVHAGVAVIVLTYQKRPFQRLQPSIDYSERRRQRTQTGACSRVVCLPPTSSTVGSFHLPTPSRSTQPPSGPSLLRDFLRDTDLVLSVSCGICLFPFYSFEEVGLGCWLFNPVVGLRRDTPVDRPPRRRLPARCNPPPSAVAHSLTRSPTTTPLERHPPTRLQAVFHPPPRLALSSTDRLALLPSCFPPTQSPRLDLDLVHDDLVLLRIPPVVGHLDKLGRAHRLLHSHRASLVLLCWVDED